MEAEAKYWRDKWEEAQKTISIMRELLSKKTKTNKKRRRRKMK